jgi:exopolyphosphatase/guanosine-5'-triphosphate,3'-diphosphate pyrophosphatase
MKALIDLGTNTFNLMIADIALDGQIRIQHSEKEGVALGMGGIHEKRITADAIERAVACLGRYVFTCHERGVTDIRAIGTSAIRDAENRSELINRVQEELGLHIEVISGIAEAQLIYRGVHQTMDFEESGVIMDIGGGSTEFILADEDGVIDMDSFNVGVSRIYELFQFSDPMSTEDILSLENYLESACGTFLRSLNSHTLIGASGSFETFFELMHERAFTSEGRAHEVQYEHFMEMLERTISSSQSERDENPHIIAIRKRMAPLAAIKTRWVMRQLKAKRIFISPYSLKEGAMMS